jgi:hypothetical protein
MLTVHKSNRALTLSAIFVIASYLLPYHVYPFRAFYNDWLMVLAFTITLALLAEQKLVSFSIPWIVAVPCGLAVVIAAQCFIGMVSRDWTAIFSIAYFGFVAICIVLGSTICAEEKGATRLCMALAWAHLLAGLISVVMQSLQFLDADAAFTPFVMRLSSSGQDAIRPHANVGQPNQLALLLCLALASVWWLFQVSRIRGSIAIGAAFCLLWGLVLTQSKVGWCVVPIFAFLVNFWHPKVGFKRVPKRWIVGLVLVYVAFVAMLPLISTLGGAQTRSMSTHFETGSIRLVFLQQALTISLSHPWFGAGWYGFGPQQVGIAADFPISEYSRHAHNIVLNFAAEIGWPITLLVFGTVLTWFIVACFRRPISREVAFASLFFIAASVHSLVEYPLWYAYVLLPMAFMIGMVHHQQFGSQAIKLSRVIPMAFCLLMSVGLVGIAMDYRRVVLGFRALGLEAVGVKPDAGSTIKPSITVFPDIYDYFKFANTVAHEGMSNEEIGLMEGVAKRFGYAPVLMRMSFVYALNARPHDAVRALMTISRLHPGHYTEAYRLWKNLADAEPRKYAGVFAQLPAPFDASTLGH